MINTLRRAATLGALMMAAILHAVAPAFSQAPTEAQRDAIKSHAAPIIWRIAPASRRAAKPRCNVCRRTCRASRRVARVRCGPSKRRAGAEGRNRAAPPAEAAPAAAAKPATETAAPNRRKPASAAAKQPSSAQVSAIRSACRSDYPKVCAGVPTGGAPALQCLEKNKAKALGGLRAGGRGRQRRRRCAAGAAAAAAQRAAAAAPRPPAVVVLRPMRPREELFVLRSACGADVRSLCGGVAPGGGRIVQCLATSAASLSPACKDVLAQFAAQ